MRTNARLAFVAVVLVALAVAGCAQEDAGPYEHPAARRVQAVLELRAEDVRDVNAYVPYFQESAVATALAEWSEVPTGTRRVPEWQPPYVSAQGKGTADVVVVWKRSEAFPDWPPVNIFSLVQYKGRWVITDALEASEAPRPLASDE